MCKTLNNYTLIYKTLWRVSVDTKIYVSVTDNNWFNYLADMKPDEVNFWQPGGKTNFKAIDENDLFLFKLYSPLFFNMTIKENLLLAKKDASDEQLYEVCKQAYIHDYIMSLPLQYDTIIQESGTNFSHGQKQRLAIARAILKGSKIILFDEPTSALDNESKYFIKKSIDELSQNHTIIIIAHRLSTIIDCDKIIVIAKGKVAGIGTHNILINNNIVYKNLYKSELNLRATK